MPNEPPTACATAGEDRITFKAAARTLTKDGKPVHVSTLHRWRLRGIKGIKLRTWCVGGVHTTSQQAISEFIERVSATPQFPTTSPTPTQRQNQIAAAAAALHAAGF